MAVAALTLRLRRYEIAEESMSPTLSPGDRVLATRHPHRVKPGDVVVFELRPGFDVVKRVAVPPPGVDGVWVLGDNPGAGSVDSRTLGPIAPERIEARVEMRSRPRPIRAVGRDVPSPR
ncbi:MAG: S26 family signal peptidase [Actinomycetota bacterium]